MPVAARVAVCDTLRRGLPDLLFGVVVAQYLPFADEHSIQEAVVSVQFQLPLPPHLVNLVQEGVLEAHEDAFPRVREMHGSEIFVDMNDASGTPPMQAARLIGFELSRPRSDGTPARILRLARDALQVSFLEYTKWDDVASASLSYVRAAVARVPLSDMPVAAFGLRYVDRFTFDGTLEQASSALLFREGASYLPPHCFESGPLWHCNLGWFENRSEQERVLNQLNVASAVIDDVPTVTIDHNATWHLRHPRQTGDSLFGEGDAARTPLKQALDALHEGNKGVIRAVLLDDILKRIGLVT